MGLSFALAVRDRKIPHTEQNNLFIQPDANANRVPASTQSQLHSPDGTMKLVARSDDFLAKPFDIDSLLEKVSKYVANTN